jgi:hypothetical protein
MTTVDARKHLGLLKAAFRMPDVTNAILAVRISRLNCASVVYLPSQSNILPPATRNMASVSEHPRAVATTGAYLPCCCWVGIVEQATIHFVRSPDTLRTHLKTKRCNAWST